MYLSIKVKYEIFGTSAESVNFYATIVKSKVKDIPARSPIPDNSTQKSMKIKDEIRQNTNM